MNRERYEKILEERKSEQKDYDAMIAGKLDPKIYDKRWGQSRGA